MIIDTSYEKKVLKVDLTIGEIEKIINEFERTEHNIYDFLNYKELIKKLRGYLDAEPKNSEREDLK